MNHSIVSVDRKPKESLLTDGSQGPKISHAQPCNECVFLRFLGCTHLILCSFERSESHLLTRKSNHPYSVLSSKKNQLTERERLKERRIKCYAK